MAQNTENLKEIIEQECAKHVKGVRSQIQKLLQQATLSLLGLDTSGRRVEIDHCNGRQSVLIDAFRQCAIEEAKKIATNYRPTSDSIVQYAATFQREFDSCFRQAITNQAREKAKDEAKRVLSAIQVDVDKILAEISE